MKFIPIIKEELKDMCFDKPYIVIGVTKENELCLELERDHNRRSAFVLKIKQGKIAPCQIKGMFEYVANYMHDRGVGETDRVLCFAEDIATATAMADIFSDIFKIKRELHLTDKAYQNVYSAFYGVAVEYQYLPLV